MRRWGRRNDAGCKMQDSGWETDNRWWMVDKRWRIGNRSEIVDGGW
jgi:hypothetical protein